MTQHFFLLSGLDCIVAWDEFGRSFREFESIRQKRILDFAGSSDSVGCHPEIRFGFETSSGRSLHLLQVQKLFLGGINNVDIEDKLLIHNIKNQETEFLYYNI